ncbi:hypothetical protein [Clostridium drakei]|uniref:Uncharacterized protein n=1 Tax=Clostridium drakei TaxID=332101 RepID=A0A2U8DLP9_9CLOT|nr:hypothetical protein [Clostridium drakei]AWI03134.1 hypothetical protein B9W14_00965 [Clostridium drakei]
MSATGSLNVTSTVLLFSASTFDISGFLKSKFEAVHPLTVNEPSCPVNDIDNLAVLAVESTVTAVGLTAAVPFTDIE